MSQNGVGIIIDERKNYKDSCGLRLMIMDGGLGLQRMECCGHSMTLADEQEFTDLGIRNARMAKSATDEPLEPRGSA